MSTPHVTDLALSRRLERAEGRANVAFVESLARLQPSVGATWREVGGTLAMFGGVGAPTTQTFCLGMRGLPTAEELDALEAFFRERGADVDHEVSPLADPALLATLGARGYRPLELSSVMHQPLGADTPPAPDGPVRARRIDAGEAVRWAETAALGWGAESPELGAFMRTFGLTSAGAEGTVCFLAECDGEAIGAAAMVVHDGVALLAGASTRREWRGRGAQATLLRARLAHAAAAGCDLAMMGAAPGSASQRNAERQGFRIAYTRIKWRLHEAARGV